MTTRIDIINYLIKKYNYKTYLEIGVQNGISFRAIELPIENKIGVDPDLFSKATIHLPSDEFFKENKKTFDIIFIDGLHETNQVDKDIINALDCLNKDGIIVLHDCNPIKEEHQAVPRVSKHWNGDVWKSIVKFQLKNVAYSVCVVDTDEGIGLIKRLENGEFESFVVSEDLLTYENLERHRQLWLNLISVEEFKQLY